VTQQILADFLTRIDSVGTNFNSKQDYHFILSPKTSSLLILSLQTQQPVFIVCKAEHANSFILTSNSNHTLNNTDIKLVKALEFAFNINHSPNIVSLAFNYPDKSLYVGEDADRFLNRKTELN
jgi:hypothetical protein